MPGAKGVLGGDATVTTRAHLRMGRGDSKHSTDFVSSFVHAWHSGRQRKKQGDFLQLNCDTIFITRTTEEDALLWTTTTCSALILRNVSEASSIKELEIS